jgi:hypothetical protein
MRNTVIKLTLVAVASSLATCIIADVSDVWWIVPSAAASTLICYLTGSLLAKIVWQQFGDADRLRKNVCPRCSTFDSIQEVTSADPEIRAVDCLACDSRFGVVLHPSGRFSASYLGKRAKIV